MYTTIVIDVHCHLNFHAFAKDYDECIHEAKRVGVNKIINVGTKLDSSAKAVELAEEYDDLYAIVGVHPHHADKIELGENWLKELEELARQPKVVAIGEIGLDNYRYQSNGIVDPQLQKEIFEAQIELAHRMSLPIQIHNRHAGTQVLEILNHHKNLLRSDNPGMFHCFAGNLEVLRGALDLGFYIGFDGNITYPGLAPGESTSLAEIANATPTDRILTETDSPFLTPVPYRGSRNMPSHVILVNAFLAQLKDMSEEEMGRQTEQNAKQLFGIQ